MDYDKLIAEAKEHVPEYIRVDMCRHESVTEPTYWLFESDVQIASVAREAGGMMPWRASKLSRGVPYAQKHFVAIDQALRWGVSQ